MLLKFNKIIEKDVEVLYLKNRDLQSYIFNAIPYTEYLKFDIKNDCMISIKVYDDSNVEILIKKSCEFEEEWLSYLSMKYERITQEEFENKLKDYEKDFKN